MDTYKTAQDILSLQLNWISSADNKIPPIFAINAAMLGVIAALLPDANMWKISTALVTLLSVIPLVGSIIFLALSSFPRLSGPKGSLIFFSGIAARSEQAYIKDIADLSDDTLINDMLSQAYRNAEIANVKYEHIKWAMILSFVSLPLWLISVWSLYSI